MIMENNQEFDENISHLESKRKFLSLCSQDLVDVYNNNETRLYDLVKYIFPANVVTVFSVLFNTTIQTIMTHHFWIKLVFSCVVLFSVISVISYVVAYLLPTIDIKMNKWKQLKKYDDNLVDLIITGNSLNDNLEHEIYLYTTKLELVPNWNDILKLCALCLSIISFIGIMIVVLFVLFN